MAAISSTAVAGPRPFRVRTATAQATVGQTDWIRTPHWARYARVTLTLTASAGNADKSQAIQLVTTDPITADDAVVQNVGGFATSGGITSTGSVQYEVGPGVSGIANATAAIGASGASTVQVNAVLPDLLGIKVTNVRSTGDETYTYVVAVEFRK